ncbi:MAG: TolC family protein, partial [Pyrinomonadaceae bacterium]
MKLTVDFCENRRNRKLIWLQVIHRLESAAVKTRILEVRFRKFHPVRQANIQVDVRNALQAVRSAEARLRTAAIARENSEQQYASEQRKLDAGQSNIYQVLDRQTALVAARSVELRSQTELNKAIADLQRATG